MSQYPAGTIAGSYDCTKGYRRLMVDKKVYKEHILVWFYHKDTWPIKQIDHINGIKDDNRIENLRDVCQTVNMYNKTKAHSQNKSTGVLGVTRVGNKFYPRLKVRDKLIHLGTFSSLEEAQKTYLDFKSLYSTYVE